MSSITESPSPCVPLPAGCFLHCTLLTLHSSLVSDTSHKESSVMEVYCLLLGIKLSHWSRGIPSRPMVLAQQWLASPLKEEGPFCYRNKLFSYFAPFPDLFLVARVLCQKLSDTINAHSSINGEMYIQKRNLCQKYTNILQVRFG